MTLYWWSSYGPFPPSEDIQGYPQAHEVFLLYYHRSRMSRQALASQLHIQEKMVYHLERYGCSLRSITRLRDLCMLLGIPALLFGLVERPREPGEWQQQGYSWPDGADGFPAPGAVIRYFRQSKGWHQQDLAKALSVSEVTVRHMENNNRNLDALTRRKALAFVLSIPASAQVWLGLDPLHAFPFAVPTLLAEGSPSLSLGNIHTVQAKLWTAYYAGDGRKAGIAQAKSLLDQVGTALPLVGEAERPQWLSAQSLLLQWLVNATRETSDSRATLARAKKALEIASQSGLPDVITTALLRQTETAYVLGRDDLALAYAHALVTTPGRDVVIHATRAIAAARVLAKAASDQDDRSQVMHLLEQAVSFGGNEYGLHYDVATYTLRHAETLLNLVQQASDQKPLLLQARALLESIAGPLSPLRLVGVRVAQAQVALGLGDYEQAAIHANEALAVGNELFLAIHLPTIQKVYRTLCQTSYANEPLTAKLGLALLRHPAW